MDKYRLKSEEAQMLASFLQPMLQWLPKDRASAQTMLEHPWLSMPDDYDYKMSDLEYKKYKLRQTFEGINNDFVSGERPGIGLGKGTSKRQAEYQEYCPGARQFECNISELADSDSEVNGGDMEDNVSDVDSLVNLRSESGGKKRGDTSSSDDEESNEDERSLSFVSENNRKQEDEFNLNVSFTGGYVPNTDLSRVDKGQGNPQFAGLEIKV